MNSHNIAVVPGDGIGAEVVRVGLNVLKAVAEKHSFGIETTDYPFGGQHYLDTGEVLSDESLNQLCQHDIIYLGAVGHPDVKPGILEKGILLKLRFELDQYINLRPVKLYPGIEVPIKDKGADELDYIVVRENTGGLYSGVGGIMMKDSADEVAIQSMVYNRKQVERCLRYAFELARTRSRKQLSLIGKTNVLTHVFDLWERVFHSLGDSEYSDVTRDYYHVDAACMHMVNEPERFDVMVTTNMFGDIITDLGAVTQGGMGMAASGNLNPTREKPSMFEPVHGSAPDIAGQGIANPLAAVITVKMMLDYLGETEAGETVDAAISTVTAEGFAGQGTEEIGERLLAAIG